MEIIQLPFNFSATNFLLFASFIKITPKLPKLACLQAPQSFP
ncbi:hypothetical protein CASFOL_007338 [Castilleja foliolosa]|uniref:ATP synthase F0 subunit 8 n=1 Tax=Castilleja foliolosa TaxID=1961234 RepID=A0ABD3ECS6_9LAMI